MIEEIYKEFEEAMGEKYLQTLTLKARDCLIFDESLI